MIRANQLVKPWRRLVSSLRRREEKRSSNLFWKKFANIITRREEKRACGKELERLTNIFQHRKTNTQERAETPKTMQDAPRGKRKIKKAAVRDTHARSELQARRGVRRKTVRDEWERALLYRFVLLRAIGDSRKQTARSGDRAGGCRPAYSRQTHQALDANPSKKAQGAGDARAESAQLGDRDTLDEQAQQAGLHQPHYEAADVEVGYRR